MYIGHSSPIKSKEFFKLLPAGDQQAALPWLDSEAPSSVGGGPFLYEVFAVGFFSFFCLPSIFFFLLKVLQTKQAPGEEIGGVSPACPRPCPQPQMLTCTVKGPHARPAQM